MPIAKDGYPKDTIKKIRALTLLDHKIKGLTAAEIEKEMNISPSSQRRLMSWAQKANLIAEAEDTILEKIVPSALSRVHKAIEDEGDTSTALEILKGAGIFKKTAEKLSAAGGGGPLNAGEESLEIYLRKIRRPEGYTIPPVGEREFAIRDGEGVEDLGAVEESEASIGELVDETATSEIPPDSRRG